MSEEAAAPPSTRAVAGLLADIGVLLELNGGDGFRARAFTSAARALEGVDADLLALAREDRLTTLRGIGSGIASVVREYVLTGTSTLRDELQAATPVGLYDLLRVPGLGPKRIHILYEQLGIDSLDALEAAATSGTIAGLPGFGGKTEKKILAGIDFARSNRQLRRYPEALEAAVRILEWLQERGDVIRAEIVGQIGRRIEVIDRIDLVAASDDPGSVLAGFLALEGEVGGDVADPSTGEATLTLTDGVSVRLRCVRPAELVAALVWETGSDAHCGELAEIAVSRGGRFDGQGLVVDGARVDAGTEADVYAALGLDYVPPELREGLGEIERAREPLPRLIELSDLTGTFHCHTTYSDGKATLAAMVEAARGKGWDYLGIADHSRSAGYAGGLTIERVLAQHAEIDALNHEFNSGERPFRAFKGIESDILPDGSLDYPDDVLDSFDYVVGSVHSSFGMAQDEMTKRVLRAISHPALTILGHATGRLLLTRSGYSLDIEAVLEGAARAGVVVEINANPHRLDLDWRHIRTAAEMGILIAINPDAHSIAAIDHVVFGVNMARKAGLEARQVLNTWPVDQVAEYFAERKQAR